MPPTLQRELRAAPIIEAAEPTGRSFTARVLTYGPADSFNTRWVPGVATESLSKRLPTLAWGHDWSEPLGRATGWREDQDGLYLDFELDNPDDVPRARQAAAQLRSGTIRDVSVGFLRLDDRKEEDGTVTITKADLDEVSLVLRGAVPGAEVLSIRSDQATEGARTLSTDHVVAVAELLRAGVLDSREARHFLETGEVPAQPQSGDGSATENGPPKAAPGQPPSVTAPGKQDAPPPVSEPGDGVAAPTDEDGEGERSVDAPERPADAPAEGDADEPTDDPAEDELETLRARVLIGSRGRRS